jgi:Protein of unknown function (DUF2934)
MDGNKRKAPPRKPRAAPPRKAASSESTPAAPAKSRETVIAELAYFRALERGFTPGHESEDWFEAEAEFERRYTTRREN